MLHTNLASRPFYNQRAVRLALLGIGAIVLALTAFNLIELARLSSAQTRLGSHASDAEREADRLRADAARIRTQIDPRELQAVSVAAREANGIIDRRAFSWTALFGRFETTLPADVRIKAVQPRLEKGVFTVAVIAQARRVEDVDAFIEALEATHAFRDVRQVELTTKDKGLLEALIEGAYVSVPRLPENAHE
jgi:hypothetical protein